MKTENAFILRHTPLIVRGALQYHNSLLISKLNYIIQYNSG